MLGLCLFLELKKTQACVLTNLLSQQNRPVSQSSFPPQHRICLRVPKTAEEWKLADDALSQSVIPAVLSATTVDEKNRILCEGVCQYFSQRFGTCQPRAKTRQRRKDKDCHSYYRKLTQESEEEDEESKEGYDKPSTSSHEFYRILRLHSKESRCNSTIKTNTESQIAHRLYAKSFWRFAAQTLDDENPAVEPDFGASEAEAHFRKMFSCELRYALTLASSPSAS